jgi:tetratricopeptide (TPR) repeat protein
VIARDSSFVLAHYWLGLSLVSLGEVREAIAAFRRAAALTSDWGLALTGLAQAFAKAGQLDSALAMARALERRARREYVPALEMAIVYVALGDTEQAVDWLHRAARERSLSIALALTDPRLVPLQNHPEFKKVVGLIRR